MLAFTFSFEHIFDIEINTFGQRKALTKAEAFIIIIIKNIMSKGEFPNIIINE
jgi:hypothetical protein